MELSEICYLILIKGLGILKDLKNGEQIAKRFLTAVLGKKYIHYVWEGNGPFDILQESVDKEDEENSASTLRSGEKAQPKTDSLKTSNNHGEQKKGSLQAFPDEGSVDLAYGCLLEYCLLPGRRTSILRRAERRIAKSELASAKEWITKKTSTPDDSIHGEAQRALLQEACESALRAAEKVLDYYELRAEERKALDASSQVFWEIISTACRFDKALITETVQWALEAGLEAVNDKEDEDKSGMRDAVAIKLEKTFNRVFKILRKRVRENPHFQMSEAEFQRHLGLAVTCGEETQDTLNEVIAAARQGAERALSGASPNPHRSIRRILEKRLEKLEDRMASAIADPKRVGKHCLNFLKFEISSVRRKALRANVTVFSEDAWSRIERQTRDHLRNLRDDQKVIISQGRKGFKQLFWGLKDWETDENRWLLRSDGDVGIAELAMKLPELIGKAKTTGAAAYQCFDQLICQALHVHGRWLMTSNFYEIIKYKTGHITKRSESKLRDDGRGRNQSVAHLPDHESHRFDRDFERVDMIDKLPMDEKLREYWNVIRQNWNQYHVALKTLKEAGWNYSQIRRNQKKLIKLLAKTGG